VSKELTRKTVGGRPLPARPTRELPGTEGKVKQMRTRWRKGEHLFHPDDAKRDDKNYKG
jgi:hypothetical protein